MVRRSVWMARREALVLHNTVVALDYGIANLSYCTLFSPGLFGAGWPLRVLVYEVRTPQVSV